MHVWYMLSALSLYSYEVYTGAQRVQRQSHGDTSFLMYSRV